MNSSKSSACDQTEGVEAYALAALPADESRMFEAHLAQCAHCRQEMALLRPVIESLAAWPDVVRPSPALWGRLADRIADDAEQQPELKGSVDWRSANWLEPNSLEPTWLEPTWLEPIWREVAPGISCKLLATDVERDRVSMLVRLAPGIEYPPHSHAGVEELHLLDGELWIDDRKLYPGDYNYGAPGSSDKRVWSETGCTCVLMTSPSDVLG